MNNHKKKILIIGDNPFDKRKTGKKLGGKYTFGGVGRSVENLVTSELFLERFNFDLFDDNNRYSSIMGSLINSFSCLWKLSKKLNKKDYDLVLLYCNSVYFAFIHKFLICVVVKISNINLFVRYGGSSSFEFFSKSYMSLLFNLFFSMQAGLLVQGKTGKFFYKRFQNKRIFIESNFVMDDFISESISKEEITDSINILLTTGSDYKRKGFLVSLDSFNDNLDVGFHITAIGCNKEVINEVNKRGLKDKVKMYGDLKYSETESILKKCHILLIPSYKEGLPNLILEAMAKGLVIITTRVGSIPDVIIESENGYFVKVGNIHEIRKTLNLLLKDKSRILEISRKNIYKIKTNFSENKVVPNMINFLIN